MSNVKTKERNLNIIALTLDYSFLFGFDGRNKDYLGLNLKEAYQILLPPKIAENLNPKPYYC